jgi:hypothetical protein
VRGDSASLQQYLKTVDTVKGATLKVTWASRTVRLDRAEAIRSLRRVSRDGARFTFAANEPKLQQLKPGSILLVWGVALRKVTAIEPHGAVVVVQTDPAALGEAIQSGRIAWKAPVAFPQGMVIKRVTSPDTSARKHALHGAQPLFHYAAYVQGEEKQGESKQGEAKTGESQEENADAEEDEEEEGMTKLALGEAAGYEFEVGFGARPGRLDYEVEMAKAESGPFDPSTAEHQGERTRAHGTQAVRGGKESAEGEGKPLTPEEKSKQKEAEEEEENTKQGMGKPATPADALTKAGLFNLANELLDLRVRARGHLNDLSTEGAIDIDGASVSTFHSRVNGLQGELEVTWIARLGEQQGSWSDNVRLDIPFNFDIPLIIGGLPFMIAIGTDLLVAPALTSHHASATATYHFTYGGDLGLTATSTGIITDGDLTGDVATKARQMTSIGVSAVLVAVQAPRIGFGLGLLNTSSVAYVDMVMSGSITSAGMLALIPCRRYQLERVFHAGVETKLLGLTIPMLGTKKELGDHWRMVETEPKGYNCGT